MTICNVPFTYTVNKNNGSYGTYIGKDSIDVVC